ncbi:MAG: NfeD family protein [candidate division WOR-3 bacterium]
MILCPAIFSATVVQLTVSGAISPPVAEYLAREIRKANQERADLILITMDTPGGLDESMRTIIKEEIASDVPICVYVHPQGGRCASAGVFIAAAADLVAMAPGTNIGAAHPVSMGEKPDSVMLEKVTNDAVAYLASLYARTGRPTEWAERFVRQSVSLSADSAVSAGIANLVADSPEELLKALDGRPARGKNLELSDARVVKRGMSFRDSLLALLANPNIAYILLMIGLYGLLFELAHPGGIFPGVTGAVSLILAFYSFQTLPVNYAGVLLIILGVGLMLAEVKITSHGILGTGGVLSLLLGSIMLFDINVPYLRISWLSIAVVIILTLLLFIFVISKALRAQLWKPTTGKEGLVGEEGEALEDIKAGGKGQVFVHGERWLAEAAEDISAGDSIIVKEVKGLRIRVRKKG